MNEKFFDLKKEKQDRMINAGLKVFAQNGYRHASTDEIVKEAGISKGLLFHYFVSKAGYYAFLYDYITRFTILELTSEIRDTAIDYFDLQKEILEVEADLMEQYPFLFLFLESVRLEDDPEGLTVLLGQGKNVTAYYDEMLGSADIAGYLRIDDAQSVSDIIHFVKTGTMRETLTGRKGKVSDYTKKMQAVLSQLRHLASNL